jgi:DNA polymerase-3 subunit delta'
MDSRLQRALGSNRLGHAVIIHGKAYPTVLETAESLAGRLLGIDAGSPDHGDLFRIRSRNKSRSIDVDTIRELNQNLRLSASQRGHKVAIIEEAEQMNASAFNAFLKTLEEPPAGTFILLPTTHLSRLAPTIRSRCFTLRVPCPEPGPEGPFWEDWGARFDEWLQGLESPLDQKPKIADHFFRLYGLIERLLRFQQEIAGERWKELRAGLPDEVSKEEEEAMESGTLRQARAENLAAVAWLLRRHFLRENRTLDSERIRLWSAGLRELERTVGLLQLNLNEAAALEHFFLKLLRLWTRRDP